MTKPMQKQPLETVKR